MVANNDNNNHDQDTAPVMLTHEVIKFYIV